MPAGHNIAMDGECGRQADILMPGLTVSPFIRVINNVTYQPMIDVPDGQYATLTALDGEELDEGQVAARPWKLNDVVEGGEKDFSKNMLNANYFLGEGHGKKGPQTTILTPGKYPVNTYLWDVDNNPRYQRTEIKPGFVGVIKSAINDAVIPAFMPNAGETVDANAESITEDLGQIKAVLVEVGRRGVWRKPLESGEYYLNRKIYNMTPIDTRVQNWTYKGNYHTRKININVDTEKGTIKTASIDVTVPAAEGSAGDVITVKVEGWTVYQELRIQARVKPDYAPLVVAAVGNLIEVEDRIITPQVRSVLRNVGGSRLAVKNTAAYEEATSELKTLKARLETLSGTDDVETDNTDTDMTPEQRAQEIASLQKQIAGFVLPDPEKDVVRPTRVLDFQNERSAIEKLVAADIQEIGKATGIDIISVTLGKADLPPELLVARKVEQLSGQLKDAYTQMRSAQVQRQATEAAKARADKQGDIVAAKIAVDVSEQLIQERTNNGVAERKFMEEKAKGQSAQANVLGKEQVAKLRALEMLLKNPDVLTKLQLPKTMVFGGGGLEGAAAIFGNAFNPQSAPKPAPIK